jgi:hypothetical protein
MTLVVGRVVGPRLAIVADTMLTEHGRPLPFQKGVIKSCMLPGDLCVSFSNSPDTAGRAFREFVAKHPTGAQFSEVISFFELSSKATGNEYLVAFANPARLVKISDGTRIKSISKTQWIGDQGAYSHFREYETRQRSRVEQGRAVNAALFADEMANSPASDLFSAMRNIVANPSIPSVGGFVSVISNRDNGFRFSAYSDMLFDWPKDKPPDYNLELTDQIAFTATDENASFAVAQVSPGFMNMNLTAFYFARARRLFFFYGRDNGLADQCQVFGDLPATGIYEALNGFVQNDLKWLLMITSPQNSSGEVDTSGIKTPGVQFSFFCEANTFPKA